jgi:hypothetical protein
MRLNPAFQETGGDGHPRRFVCDVFKVHAPKPAGKDVLADLDPQPAPDARPLILMSGDHVHQLFKC